MTLLKCTTKRIFFATTIFMLLDGTLYAKKVNCRRPNFNEDGGKVKKAELTLSKDGDCFRRRKNKR